MSDTIIPIHTSDRNTYMGCRQRWDFASPIRQHLRPIAMQGPLDLGSAVHKALELYYDPKTWEWHFDNRRVMLLKTCDLAFINYMREIKRVYEDAKGPLDEIMLQEHKDLITLGLGMLKHYYDWAPDNDKFTPVFTEVNFEVDIPGMEGVTYIPFGSKVMYRGQIDVLVRDFHGDYWIIDHKTTARFDDIFDYLQMDEQCGSYIWALRQLGIQVKGIIYNQLYKGVPAPPARLKTQRKGLIFSVSKSQDTTYGLYVRALEEANEDPSKYKEFLDWLSDNPPQYFRRLDIPRSKTQVDNIERNIVAQAKEMLNPETTIYPHPTLSIYGCKGCPYKTPCRMLSDGSDVEWILKENYRKKEDGTN